jgi:hypothetical protein
MRARRASIRPPIADTIFIAMRLLLLPTLCLAACTGGMQDPSTVEQQEGACVALEGRRFESANELECGRTPNGVALCKWQLAFASRDEESSQFMWQYSDVGESGHIACDGATIIVTSLPREINATFDVATQKLVWEDQTYVPAN